MDRFIRVLSVVGVVASWFLLGCSGSGAAPNVSAAQAPTVESGASTPSGLPCAVEQVLSAHCVQCHSDPPQFGAPMPLTTFADLHATAPADPLTAGASMSVYQAVEERIHDTTAPMPQPPNPVLDATDLATLDAWVAAGAPAAATGDSCSSGSDADAGTSVSLSCTPDTVLSPGSAWSMPADLDDQYVCYEYDVTLTSERQIIAFAPHIDNTHIVHHVVLYQYFPTGADEYTSTPTPCASGGIIDGRILYVWTPGDSALSLPSNVGFPEDSGTTHFVVQVHYNNINHLTGQTDSSGFGLCTTAELRPNEADVVAFGTTKISIPAHATMTETCNLTLPAGLPALNGFEALPHMHQLGSAISADQYPGGGGQAVNLGNVPDWNFQNQSWQSVQATLNSGDRIQTICTWDNTTSDVVTYGPDTENEMCYSFLMFYPPITTPGWTWQTPALGSTCTSVP